MNINIASELREDFELFKKIFVSEMGRKWSFMGGAVNWNNLSGFHIKLTSAYSRFVINLEDFRGCDVRYASSCRLRYPNDHLVVCRQGSFAEARMNDWDRAQFQEMHAVMNLFDEILDWFEEQKFPIQMYWNRVAPPGWCEFKHPRQLYERVRLNHFRKTVRYYLFSLIASNNAKVTAARRKSIMDGVKPVTRGNHITRAINLGSNTMRRAMEFVVEERDGV